MNYSPVLCVNSLLKQAYEFYLRPDRLELIISDMQQVSAIALDEIRKLETKLMANLPYSPAQRAHINYLLNQIRMFKENPADFSIPAAPSLPDGAPIGCEG